MIVEVNPRRPARWSVRAIGALLQGALFVAAVAFVAWPETCLIESAAGLHTPGRQPFVTCLGACERSVWIGGTADAPITYVTHRRSGWATLTGHGRHLRHLAVITSH